MKLAAWIGLFVLALTMTGGSWVSAAGGDVASGGAGGDKGGSGAAASGGADVDIESSEESEDSEEEEEQKRPSRKRRINMNIPRVCKPFASSKRSMAQEAAAFMSQLGDSLFTTTGSMNRGILRGLEVSQSSFLPFFQERALELELDMRKGQAEMCEDYEVGVVRKRWIDQQVKGFRVSPEDAAAMWDKEMAPKMHAAYKKDLKEDLAELRSRGVEAFGFDGCGKKLDDYKGPPGGGAGGMGGAGGGNLTV